MALQNCPNEVLLLISGHLEQQSDLKALSFVNKPFYNTLILELYKNDARERKSALFWAVCEGEERTANLSIAAGIDVDAPPTPRFASHVDNFVYTRTPLQKAVHLGEEAIVRLLLDNGANARHLSKSGRSLLDGCGYQNIEVVRLLIQHGTKVPSQLPRNAAKYADKATLQLLVDAGLTLPARSAELVQAACKAGNTEALSFFVDNGMSLYDHDGPEPPPLFSAVVVGTTKTVEWMLKQGVDASDLSPHDHFVTTRAAFRRHGAELLKVLISYGLLIDSKATTSNSGQTPLIAASRLTEDADEASLLLELGASIDAADIFACTALHFACLAGSLRLVKLLIDRGASPFKVDNNGWTPLHCASVAKKVPVVDFLLNHVYKPLEKSMDNKTNEPNNTKEIDRADKHGLTPLHLAALQHSYQIQELLIAHGANQDARCHKGKTAKRLGHSPSQKFSTKGSYTLEDLICGNRWLEDKHYPVYRSVWLLMTDW